MPGTKHATVVLPLARNGDQFPPVSVRHRRWLARSRLSRSAPGELLSQVLPLLAAPTPPHGFGALRLWGQTGTRPEGWLAAADPVFLEARLDHVVLHRLDEAELDDVEVAGIFDYLQENLGAGADSFTGVGKFGYVHRHHPMEVAQASPAVAQGNSPEDFLPTGEQARAHDRLQGEVQMCLYESPANRRRADAGKPPVNGLWMWGGGATPALSRMPLPPLYADEPLFKGFWLGASAVAADWPGDLDTCLELSPNGFVAVLPEFAAADAGGQVDTHLAVLRRMLQRGRLRAVTLVTGGGVQVKIDRWSALRLWRRKLTLP